MAELIKHGFQKVDLCTSSNQSLINDTKAALNVTVVDDAVLQRYTANVNVALSSSAAAITSSVHDLRNYKLVLMQNVIATAAAGVQSQMSLDNVNWFSAGANVTASGILTLTGYCYFRTVSSLAATAKVDTYIVAGN